MKSSCHQSELNEAAAALARMTATIAVAQGLAQSGRTIDLIGLDEAAGQLCARMLDLAPSASTPLRPALVELDLKLAALSALLTTRLP